MVERKWVEGATTSRRLLVETLNFHWKLVCVCTAHYCTLYTTNERVCEILENISAVTVARGTSPGEDARRTELKSTWPVNYRRPRLA